MSIVPDWDDPWGWHRFVEGNTWSGPDWCDLCDNLDCKHTPLPEGFEEKEMSTPGGIKFIGAVRKVN